MSRGGPYSKRNRTWPHRHAGGGKSGENSRRGFPRTSFGSGGGNALNTAHLLERRARKEANRVVDEARKRETRQRAIAEGRKALASWIASAGLSQAELNFIVNAGGFPPARIVIRQITAIQRKQVGIDRWGDPKYETVEVVVGTEVSLPGMLAKHYPSGRIPRADIAALGL